MPLQPGSWLISIFDAFGAGPSNLTVPLIIATVAGSMGVAAGADMAGCSAAEFEAGASSFLLHATVAKSAKNTNEPIAVPVQPVFLFMMSSFLFEAVANLKSFVIPSEPERTRPRPEESASALPPEILPRTSAHHMQRRRRRLPVIAGTLHGRFRMRHRRRHTPLFFRSQLEDVIGQQLAMIAVVPVKCRRRRTGENVSAAFRLEQARWHRRPRTDCGRIGDPPLYPIRLQALFRQQEVGRRRNLVVRWI